MLFSVDAHAIGRKLTGNEVYVRSLLTAFAAVDPESDFIAYISGAVDGVVPARFQTRRVSPNPFVRLGFEMSRTLRRDRPDLLHVQYTAPLACPVPVVVSVHDVSFVEHPEFFTRARAAQLRLTVKRTVARAARVITGSDFSRSEIVRTYGVDPERIVVVPNAAAARFRPTSRAAATAWIQEHLAIPHPFILTVGDLQPRKNQIGLIRAYAEMTRAFPQLAHHLVLAGKEQFQADDVRRAAERSGAGDRIHFTGFVTDDELLQLYNACDFFVFPSFYEGFGLPVLEAMACGKAVACSDNSAVSEVADGAALLFDPQSRGEMIRAMLDLALDAELRARMERLGSQRAAHFSWRKTAERTLAVYHDVALAARQSRRREQVRSASVSNR